MTVELANQALRGGIVLGCWAIGLFFNRYWSASRDRLFVFFAAGFWVFGLHWAWLLWVGTAEDVRHHAYVLRLVAFLLLLIGIVDKNRRSR